jgi:hypothetical protein
MSVGSRRSPVLWWVPLVLLSLAGVLIATFSDNPGAPATTSAKPTQAATTSAAAPSTTSAAAGEIQIQGGGMTIGRTIGLAGVPGSVSLGTKNVWISLPDRGELVRSSLRTGAQRTSAASGRPTALVAGTRALWVTPAASTTLAQFNGGSGAQVHTARLTGHPVAIALDQADSTAWVADSTGAISHVGLGPPGTRTPAPVIGTPAHTTPAATSIAAGEGWLWATIAATHGLVRVSLGRSGSSTTYPAGQHPVAVTLDQGVWTATANGHVTRFDPRPGKLRVNADVAVAPQLDAIAATDPGPFVWAISKSRKTLYRVTNTSKPAVTGTVVFKSSPVALAVDADSVWVATQDHKVTQIRF